MNLAAFEIENDDVFFDANFIRDGNYKFNFNEEQTMKFEYSKNDATNFSIKFIQNPSKYVKTCDVCNGEAHVIFIVCDNVNVLCLSCFQEMKGVVDASLKLYNDTK